MQLKRYLVILYICFSALVIAKIKYDSIKIDKLKTTINQLTLESAQKSIQIEALAYQCSELEQINNEHVEIREVVRKILYCPDKVNTSEVINEETSTDLIRVINDRLFTESN